MREIYKNIYAGAYFYIIRVLRYSHKKSFLKNTSISINKDYIIISRVLNYTSRIFYFTLSSYDILFYCKTQQPPLLLFVLPPPPLRFCCCCCTQTCALWTNPPLSVPSPAPVGTLELVITLHLGLTD